MNDAKDAAIVRIVLEDLVDVVGVGDVAFEELDFGVGLVLLRAIGGQSFEGELGNALAGFRKRVVEAVRLSMQVWAR